jgi:hypothetical protein
MKAEITQIATVISQAIFDSGTGGYSRPGPMTPALRISPIAAERRPAAPSVSAERRPAEPSVSAERRPAPRS